MIPLHYPTPVFYKFLTGILYFIIASSAIERVPAQDFSTGSLKFPWAGGINSCQFNRIDLDLDGKKDLLVFDRTGNRILPLISTGAQTADNYSYRPEFAASFPDLHDWIILADYDCDDKDDIFTYGLGGIRIFHNTSDTVLKFKLVTDLLTSYYYTGKVGILVTPVDYPAISDIDGDGDLDLLTFFGFGSFVEFHRNYSMEKFKSCDSLDFKLEEKCWGDFKESESSNKVTLNISCPYKHPALPGTGCTDMINHQRHTGSTLTLLDLNGDGAKDLLLGDVDYPGIIALYNGGTPDSAHMISQDTLFPSGSTPVFVFSFPGSYTIDADNDSIRDLLVSPFDPGLNITDNFHSSWFYKNKGSDTQPDFEYITDRFIQNEMIDVGSNSYPILSDLDGDGLPDLIIGNWGYYDTSFYQEGVLKSTYISKLSFYRNMGSLYHPVFHLESIDFASLSALKLTGLFPAFGDADGDGDYDMVTGNTDGSLLYFENTAGIKKIPVFKSPVYNYGTIDVGDFSTPCLFDVDNDGRCDLIIGEQNGNLNYYRNTGTGTLPVFSYVTDSLGRINTTNPSLSYWGYSTPFIFKDQENNINLLVGSEEGKIHFYPAIGNDLTGKFGESDSLFHLISANPVPIKNLGWRTACTISRLTDPVLFDLIAGNYSGGLNYFSNAGYPDVISGIEVVNPGERPATMLIYPNPCGDELHVRLSRFSRPENLTIKILSMPGNVVKSFFYPGGSDEMTVSCKEVPAGIYILQAGHLFRKVIIIH